MENMQKQAHDFVRKNRIARLPVDIDQIALELGYAILRYSSAVDVCPEEYRDRMQKYDGFSYSFNDAFYIVVGDDCSADQRRCIIAHEIGHHICDTDREDIADAFARGILAPMRVLQKYNLHSVHDVVRLTGLDQKNARIVYRQYREYVEHVSARRRRILSTAIRGVICAGAFFTLGWCLNSALHGAEHASPVPVESPAAIVYVTPSGKKFHRENCQYIKKSETVSMTIEEARAAGYDPCAVCQPD